LARGAGDASPQNKPTATEPADKGGGAAVDTDGGPALRASSLFAEGEPDELLAMLEGGPALAAPEQAAGKVRGPGTATVPPLAVPVHCAEARPSAAEEPEQAGEGSVARDAAALPSEVSLPSAQARPSAAEPPPRGPPRPEALPGATPRPAGHYSFGGVAQAAAAADDAPSDQAAPAPKLGLLLSGAGAAQSESGSGALTPGRRTPERFHTPASSPAEPGSSGLGRADAVGDPGSGQGAPTARMRPNGGAAPLAAAAAGSAAAASGMQPSPGPAPLLGPGYAEAAAGLEAAEAAVGAPDDALTGSDSDFEADADLLPAPARALDPAARLPASGAAGATAAAGPAAGGGAAPPGARASPAPPEPGAPGAGADASRAPDGLLGGLGDAPARPHDGGEQLNDGRLPEHASTSEQPDLSEERPAHEVALERAMALELALVDGAMMHRRRELCPFMFTSCITSPPFSRVYPAEAFRPQLAMTSGKPAAASSLHSGTQSTCAACARPVAAFVACAAPGGGEGEADRAADLEPMDSLRSAGSAARATHAGVHSAASLRCLGSGGRGLACLVRWGRAHQPVAARRCLTRFSLGKVQPCPYALGSLPMHVQTDPGQTPAPQGAPDSAPVGLRGEAPAEARCSSTCKQTLPRPCPAGRAWRARPTTGRPTARPSAWAARRWRAAGCACASICSRRSPRPRRTTARSGRRARWCAPTPVAVFQGQPTQLVRSGPACRPCRRGACLLLHATSGLAVAAFGAACWQLSASLLSCRVMRPFGHAVAPAERRHASSPPSAAPRQACFHGLVALGLSSGLTLVLLPRGLGAADGAAAAAAPQVARLGAPRPGDDAAARPPALPPRARRDACQHAGRAASG